MLVTVNSTIERFCPVCWSVQLFCFTSANATTSMPLRSVFMMLLPSVVSHTLHRAKSVCPSFHSPVFLS